MNAYSQFCFVIDKSGAFKGVNFESIGNGLYAKGMWLSSSIIGNVFSYQKSKGLIEVKEGLEGNAKAFLKDFIGDFSFVFLPSDSRKNSFIAARDHMGIFPLFYYNDEKMLVIANDQRLMIDIEGINLKKNDKWIADYVFHNGDDQEGTFYLNIKKVPPAHFLIYEAGKIEIEKYWELDIHSRLAKKTDKEYIDEFRSLLKEAVECRIPNDVNVGSEVSGGIDCTSIAAIAKAHLDESSRKLYTYAHAAMDDNNPSEKKAIEKYLTHLKPFKHTFIPLEMKGMRAVAHPTLMLRNGVSKSHYALFSRDIYRAAQRDQVKVILSGNGGDHCVSFKAVVGVIQQLIAEGSFKMAWKELRLLHGGYLKSIFKFITAVLNFWIESPLAKKNSQGFLEKSDKQNRDWLSHFYPSSSKLVREKKITQKKFIPIRTLIFDRLYRGDVSERGEHTTIAAAEFGVLYRYPLLDVRLLQYMVSLPTHLYYHDKMNRYIFREAIKPYVPLYLAMQPKPPGNMYCWISEAYDYDNKHHHNDEVKIPQNDEEMEFYFRWWEKKEYWKNKLN